LDIPKNWRLFWRVTDFSDNADSQGHVTTILKIIPEDEFQKCFEQWKHWLTKCIGMQGNYFEGESNY
jgi:hypothetical protein